MAEAIASANYPQHQYESAGLYEGPPDYLAIEVMNEIGLDISGHQPKSFESLKDKKFDLVISLTNDYTPEVKKALEKHNLNVEYWPDIPSPGMVRGNRYMQLFGYREIRDKLRSKLRQKFS